MDSRSIIKIKTTHRLKISTEKIQYRKDRQKEGKSPEMNYDYFMSKGKNGGDKMGNNKMKNSQVMNSPKIKHTSKSSSRR